jgi:hypothetical protein
VRGGQRVDDVAIRQAGGSVAMLVDDDLIQRIVDERDEDLANRIRGLARGTHVGRSPFQFLDLRRPLMDRLRIGGSRTTCRDNRFETALENVVALVRQVLGGCHIRDEDESCRRNDQPTRAVHE